MTKRTRLLKGVRYFGLLGIVLSGLVAIIGTGGGGTHGSYLVDGKLIHEAPPPATDSPFAPVIFDLSFISTGDASITFSVSFTDSPGDVTTFCIAFDDQPNRYYAYDVEDETYGETSYRLSVTDTMNFINTGTYCFTVFIQDEAGNTSNKLRGCFSVECEDCNECQSDCHNGTMTISGTLDGDPIDLSGNACARKGDDIVVALIYCDGFYIALEIKEPDKLISGTTLAVNPYEGDEIMPDDFPVVVERFNPDHWEQSASGGTFTVITYNENGLNATYELIMPDGGLISGEINVWRFEDFDQAI